MAGRFRHEDVAQAPPGWRVRTVTQGAHRVRVACGPGNACRTVSILHPTGEKNPCNMRYLLRNPSELLIMGANPHRARPNPSTVGARIAQMKADGASGAEVGRMLSKATANPNSGRYPRIHNRGREGRRGKSNPQYLPWQSGQRVRAQGDMVRIRERGSRYYGDKLEDQNTLSQIIGRVSFPKDDYSSVFSKVTGYGYGLITVGPRGNPAYPEGHGPPFYYVLEKGSNIVRAAQSKREGAENYITPSTFIVGPMMPAELHRRYPQRNPHDPSKCLKCGKSTVTGGYSYGLCDACVKQYAQQFARETGKKNPTHDEMLEWHARRVGAPWNTGTIYDSIRARSRVTIVTPQGQRRTGRAVMLGPAGWVLNLGGAHGTPGIASPDNTVAVSGRAIRNPRRLSGYISDAVKAGAPAFPHRRERKGRRGNPVKLTRELAWAASKDAADRSMRAGGRTKWSREDANVQARTFNKLWPVERDLEMQRRGEWGAGRMNPRRGNPSETWRSAALEITDGPISASRYAAIIDKHRPTVVSGGRWVQRAAKKIAKKFRQGGMDALSAYDAADIIQAESIQKNPSGAAELRRLDLGQIMQRARRIGKELIEQTATPQQKRKLEVELAAIRKEIRRRQIANPSGAAVDAASELYSEFHGRGPKEILELEEPERRGVVLTSLGTLLALTIDPAGKNGNGHAHVALDFTGEGIKLASSSDGKQLHLVGGNQAISDADLKRFGTDTSKELVELGEVRGAYENWRAVKASGELGAEDSPAITYRSSKAFTDHKASNWWHEFAEEGGQPPIAVYDKPRRRIVLVGGSYRVEAPGIIN